MRSYRVLTLILMVVTMFVIATGVLHRREIESLQSELARSNAAGRLGQTRIALLRVLARDARGSATDNSSAIAGQINTLASLLKLGSDAAPLQELIGEVSVRSLRDTIEIARRTVQYVKRLEQESETAARQLELARSSLAMETSTGASSSGAISRRFLAQCRWIGVDGTQLVFEATDSVNLKHVILVASSEAAVQVANPVDGTSRVYSVRALGVPIGHDAASTRDTKGAIFDGSVEQLELVMNQEDGPNKMSSSETGFAVAEASLQSTKSAIAAVANSIAVALDCWREVARIAVNS